MSTLRLHPLDDVVIAKASLPKGTVVETELGPTVLREAIGAGHKIAFRARAEGAPIHRYGQVIGFASIEVRPGDHVHTHNLRGGELHLEPSAPERSGKRLHPRVRRGFDDQRPIGLQFQ